MKITAKDSLIYSSIFALLLTLVSLMVPVVGLVIIGAAIGLYLANRFKLPIIRGLILAVLLVISYIGAFEFIASIVAPTTPNFISLHVSLIILAAIALRSLITSKMKFSRQFLFNSWKEELTSTILALASVLLFAIPLLHPHDASVTISFLSAGEDNASHFAMMNYGIENQRAPYLAGQTSGLLNALNAYPQGIHSAFAFFYNSVLGQDGSANKRLFLYASAILFAVATLTYMISVICLRLLRTSSYRFIVAISACTIISFFLTTVLVTYGFLTQIFAYSLLLGLLVLLQSITLTKRNRPTFILMSAVLILGIVFSWYLLAPVAALLVFSTYRKAVFKDRSLVSFLYILLAVLVSVGIVAINTLGRDSGNLTTPGGVYQYELWVYILGFAGIGLFSAYRYFVAHKKPTVFDNLAYATLALTLLIGIYQLLTVHELRYYYFKSIYLVLILGFIAGLALIAELIEKRMALSTPWVTALLVLGLSEYLLFAQPGYIRVYLDESYWRNIEPSMIRDSIQKDRITRQYDAVFIGDCPVVTKYTLNRWMGALHLSETNARAELYAKSFARPNKFDVLYTSYANRTKGAALNTVRCSNWP